MKSFSSCFFHKVVIKPVYPEKWWFFQEIYEKIRRLPPTASPPQMTQLTILSCDKTKKQKETNFRKRGGKLLLFLVKSGILPWVGFVGKGIPTD